MTKQRAKTTLLIVAAAAVTGLSIYLGFKRGFPSRASVQPGTPSMPGPTVPAEEEPDGSWMRPRVGDLGTKVHGLTGELAGAHRRVLGEGEQILGRFKGKAGRHLPDVGLGPDVPG